MPFRLTSACRYVLVFKDTVVDKWVTTVTDVMILNYAVGLDVARDATQCDTQGVWPCQLPIDSLPLHMNSSLMRVIGEKN